jgi:phage tail tape-measure protein
LWPTVNQAGRQPGDDALAYANYDRALQEDQLGSQVDKFNYLRDQPYNQLNWYGSLVNGTASPYGQQTTQMPAGSRAAGALGGALAGYQLGNQMGNGNIWGQLIGTGIGGYLGGWG